jgi:hypothetical protein
MAITRSQTAPLRRKIARANRFFVKIHAKYRSKYHIESIDMYNQTAGKYPMPIRWRKCKDKLIGNYYWIPIHLEGEDWKYTDYKAHKWCLTYEPHWNPSKPIYPKKMVEHEPTGKLEF